MSTKPIMESEIIGRYGDVMLRMLSLAFPTLTRADIVKAIEYSVNKRYKEEPAKLYNNYTEKTVETTLLQITEYIFEREPIVCASGIMFKKHGTVPNPLLDLMKLFLDSRDIDKAKMFTFPKGSEEYEYWNLMQLLDKLDANALYGALGMASCLYYNVHVAQSTTSQGQALISAAMVLFESVLANGVKFGSLDEVVMFINNTIIDPRRYNDADVIDGDICAEQCFAKLMWSCGFGWIPTMDDMDIMWHLVNNMSQGDRNRLYYRNNIYEFINNTKMTELILKMLTDLKQPYLNPNKAPDEIKANLALLSSYLMDYVYYPHQIIDSVDRNVNMIKSVTMISDTDSAIISLDAWYRCILEKTDGIDMMIKKHYTNPFVEIKYDEFGDITSDIDAFKPVEIYEDFDFVNDEIIELERMINPLEIIPQDNLRYSIINILAYCLTDLINDYMKLYCDMNNSNNDVNKECLIIMKNEFTFKRALLTNAKKHYATIPEVQEGHMIPISEQLDIKGLQMDNSTLNKKSKDELQKIMYEDVLNIPEVDQIRIIKKIKIMEKKIYNSLLAGDTDYYKPIKIKSISAYPNPMSIQGIKASIVWNELRDNTDEALNMNERNSILLVKTNITPYNIEDIREMYPDKYDKLVKLFGTKDFGDKLIKCVALPRNQNMPHWLIKFINFKEIINDNIKFPLDSVGIQMMDNSNISYTNIVKI